MTSSAQKILDWVLQENVDGLASENLLETSLEEIESNDTVCFTVQHEDDSQTSKENKMFRKVDDLINHMNRLWERSIYEKPALSKIDSIYTYCTTGEIASEQVISGSDGWMFYRSRNIEDSLGDYEGKNYYTQNELKRILQIVFKTQETIEKKGIHFALLSAPNKESIYSEYMPKQYYHEPISRTELLFQYLKDNGIHAGWPKEDLLDNKQSFLLYYPRDTHWNQLGAYIGVKNVLQLWNIELPALEDRAVISYELKDHYHDVANDDLARMAGLIAFFDQEMDFQLEGTCQPDWEIYNAEQTQGKLSHIVNKEAYLHKTLFLIGDSFRAAMIPAFSEVFQDVYVIHRDSYQPDMLEFVQPDYFILVYVERFSGEIADMDHLIERDNVADCDIIR